MAQEGGQVARMGTGSHVTSHDRCDRVEHFQEPKGSLDMFLLDHQ